MNGDSLPCNCELGALRPQQPEGVHPLVFPKPRNAPELSQGLDSSRRHRTSHIDALPAEVLEQPGHHCLRLIVVAAVEHRRWSSRKQRVHHEAATYAVECLDEVNGREGSLES